MTHRDIAFYLALALILAQGVMIVIQAATIIRLQGIIENAD